MKKFLKIFQQIKTNITSETSKLNPKILNAKYAN